MRAKALKRGGAVFLTLSALFERPMCGYEVIKWISDRFFGFYKPSPGLIYPVLKRLEDEGYVDSKIIGNRRLYSITEEGKRHLEEIRECMNEVIGEKLSSSRERSELIKSFMKLRREVLLTLMELDPERLEEVKAILDDARKRIREVTEAS